MSQLAEHPSLWPPKVSVRSTLPGGSSPPRTISTQCCWAETTEQAKLIGSPNQVEAVRAPSLSVNGEQCASSPAATFSMRRSVDEAGADEHSA